MPTYRIQAPDGRFYEIEGPEGASQAQVAQAVLAQNPEAGKPATPKSGFLPALKAGVENLKGDVAALAGRSGIMDLKDAENYRQSKEAEARRIFKPTEDNWIESPLTKVGELAGGSLPYMAAPVVAGGAATLAGAPAIVGGTLAGLASATQFTGSNLSRQMDEGKKLGETDLQAAALAAVPQAALDMVSFKMTPGIRNLIFKQTGKKVSTEAAQEIAKQGLKTTLADYAKATGKTMTAEGLTEAGQQVFERMQAGLNLTDPQAQKEYWDNFLGGAVLGGVLAPVGHAHERSVRREQEAKAATAKEQAERAAALQARQEQEAAEQARRQDPAYLNELVQQAGAYKQQIAQLQEAAKGAKDADPVVAANARAAIEQLKGLKSSDAYRTHLSELEAAAPALVQRRAEEAKAKAAALNDPALQQQLYGQFDALSAQLAEARNQADAAVRAGNHEAAARIAEQADAMDKQRQALQEQLGQRPAGPKPEQLLADMQAELQRLVGGTTAKGFPKAGEIMKLWDSGDRAGALQLNQRAQELRDKIEAHKQGVSELERRTQEAEQQHPGTPGTNPMADFLTDMESMNEGRSENAAINEVRQMEAGRMNPNVTEQRTLFAPDTGTKEVSSRDTLLQQYKTLVKQLGDMRRARRDDPNRQPEIEAVLEQLRDIKTQLEGGGNRPADTAFQTRQRGQATAGIAPELAGTNMPEQLPEGQQVEGVERTLAPAKASAERVQAQLQALPERLAPEDEAIVRQIVQALPALQNSTVPAERRAVQPIEGAPYDKTVADMAPVRALDDVSAYLHRLRTGADATDEAGRVQEHLVRLEQGKRSETQTVTRETPWGTAARTETAVQEDMFENSDINGTLFNSYAEFENYLASDAVNEARKAVGQLLPTVARLRKELAPLEARRNELQARLEQLQQWQQMVIAGEQGRVSRAQQKHATALANLQTVQMHLEAQLEPMRAQLTQAEAAVSKAVQQQVKISDTIAKNAAKFNRDPGLQQAAGKVAAAQSTYAAAIKQAGVDAAKGDMRAAERTRTAYNSVVSAINEHRTMLEQYQRDSRKLQERSVLAFLNKDMELMLRLRSAEEAVDIARIEAHFARQALQSAQAALANDPETKALTASAQKDVSAAASNLKRAKTIAAKNRADVAEDVSAADARAREVRAEIEKRTAPVEQARAARTAAPVAETQADREARDNEQRRLAQERAERLEAIPGVRVSHPNVEKLMDEIDRSRDRVRTLDAAAKDTEKSEAARKKATVEAKALRDRLKVLYGSLSGEADLSAAAKEEFANRIAAQEDKIAAKQAAVNEEGISAAKKRSRSKELYELRSELRKLRAYQRMTQQRAVTAPTGISSQTTRALADKLDALQERIQSEGSADVQETLKKQAKQIQDELDRRDEAENRLTLDRGTALATLGTTGKLPRRKIGPVVKNAMNPGLIRTGTLDTISARTVALRNKPTQGGKTRGVTTAVATKQAAKDTALEQAMLQDAHVEELQQKNAEALAAAKEAGDTAKVDKFRAYADRLDAARKKTTAAIEKAGGVAPEERMLDEEDVGGAVFRTAPATGAGLEKAKVQALAQRIVADWTNKPEVATVQSVDELPQHLQDQMAADEQTTAPGMYDPTTGKVYLVADNLHGPEDVALTVAHEITGHYGLRDLLGNGYAKLMNDIYDSVPEVRKLADEKLAASKNLSREVAVEEVLADRAETQPGKTGIGAALSRIFYAVKAAVRALVGKAGFKPDMLRITDAEVRQIVANARRHVKRGTPGGGPKGGVKAANAQTAVPAPAYRSAKMDTTSAAGQMAAAITAAPVNPVERLKKNAGLSFEMMAVDMRAPLMKALSRADEKTLTQASYFVRKADALMNHVYAALGSGPLQLTRDSKGMFKVEGGNGPSMKAILEAVGDVRGVSTEDKMAKVQAYLVAQRAARVGWDKLNFEPATATKLQKLAADMNRELAADPAQKQALDKVRDLYNQYNKGMVQFLADTGYLSKAKAAELTQHGDYVPFYRVSSKGIAELVMGEGAVIHVGDLRNNKYLAELKGDDQKLLPLNEAMIRNTMLLTDLGMKNLASKDVAYALQSLGTGKIRRGRGEADPSVIRFRQEPTGRDDTGERYIHVSTAGTAVEDIPSDMLVQSLEGTFSTLPAGLKWAARFGDILRSGVTRNPMYIARQLVRDPMSAAFTGGLESGIVTSTLKTLKNFVAQSRGTSKEGADLLRKGLIHSNIFTGDVDDIKKISMQLAGGDQSAFQKTLAWWDRAAMNADAATRIQLYKDALGKGMSEVEAEYAAMEMMNFNKRGMSPTVQYASRMIPFLNAQIQGLNVLAKAARGNMPQNAKLAIKEKFYRRATMMAMFTLAYAMAMDDDDTYKNARPRDRYNNWFLPNPAGGEHIKIPIPFEVGLLFKTLPEALVDAMKGDFGKQEFDAVRRAFVQQIPGAGSYGLPQIIKPAIETVTNHSFLTGREIESRSDQAKVSQERFGPGTTEIAKEMSKILNASGLALSPKQIDHLISGYLGSMPIMVARLTNSLFDTAEGPVRPAERGSDNAIVGALFQKEQGGRFVDYAYDQQQAVTQAQATYNEMLSQGRKADAEAFRENVLNALAAPELTKRWATQNAALVQMEKNLRLRIKDPEVLREKLDLVERKRNELAKMYFDVVQQIAH